MLAIETDRPERLSLGSFSGLFRPLTRFQRTGLLGFLLASGFDVVLSALLFFGGGGAFVEANPVLAWATESILLFLAAVLAVKAIGAGLLALLASLANNFSTLAGDAVLFAALFTTAALFIMELVVLDIAPSLGL
jgi:hypothetical protein